MNPPRFHTAFFFIIAMMAAPSLLAGCSSFRTEMGRPLSAEARGFVEGRTRVDTVLRSLGPPNQVSRLPDGFAFLYEYSLMSEFQFGFSADIEVFRWFKFVHAWNRLSQETLILTFDAQGVLRSVGSAKWGESLGGGTAVQILFTAMSLSDVSKFLRPAETHGWGKALLQLPPITLNSAQSLRSGEHGFQQRIAPDYAGQHTLEMKKPETEREKRRAKRNYQLQQEDLR